MLNNNSLAKKFRKLLLQGNQRTKQENHEKLAPIILTLRQICAFDANMTSGSRFGERPAEAPTPRGAKLDPRDKANLIKKAETDLQNFLGLDANSHIKIQNLGALNGLCFLITLKPSNEMLVMRYGVFNHNNVETYQHALTHPPRHGTPGVADAIFVESETVSPDEKYFFVFNPYFDLGTVKKQMQSTHENFNGNQLVVFNQARRLMQAIVSSSLFFATLNLHFLDEKLPNWLMTNDEPSNAVITDFKSLFSYDFMGYDATTDRINWNAQQGLFSTQLTPEYTPDNFKACTLTDVKRYQYAKMLFEMLSNQYGVQGQPDLTQLPRPARQLVINLQKAPTLQDMHNVLSTADFATYAQDQRRSSVSSSSSYNKTAKSLLSASSSSVASLGSGVTVASIPVESDSSSTASVTKTLLTKTSAGSANSNRERNKKFLSSSANLSQNPLSKSFQQ